MAIKINQLYKCFLIMLICYLTDSLVTYFLPYNFTKTGITFVPAIGLMMFILLVITLTDVASRFFFATICGLFYCIVYSSSLVIYVLIYLMITFVRSFIYRNDHITILEYLVFIILTLLFKEALVYYLMILTKVTRLSLIVFVTKRLLPILLINAVLSIGVYFIFNQFHFKIEADPFGNE